MPISHLPEQMSLPRWTCGVENVEVPDHRGGIGTVLAGDAIAGRAVFYIRSAGLVFSHERFGVDIHISNDNGYYY